MKINGKVTAGVATLLVAMGAGHFVQSQFAARAERQAAAEAAPKAITPLAATTEPETAPAPAPAAKVPAAEATAVEAPAAKTPAAKAAEPAPAPAAVAALTPEVAGEPAAPRPAALPATAAPEPEAAPPAPAATDCTASMDVTAGHAGTLDFVLLAPCAGDTRVVLRHGPLTFAARTSAEGALFFRMPAIESKGEVAAIFPNGTLAVDADPVALTGIRRVVVQWAAGAAFELNAYENGAVWDGAGHVSARKPAGAGAIRVLGESALDLPLQAQVYTFPATPLPVRIAVEAPVTEATCGHPVAGQLIESRDGSATVTALTLAMPDCGAVGDVLVLNNLFEGTTLASVK
jgi:hypothetical protein